MGLATSTMGLLGLGLGAASTAAGAYASYQEAKAAQAAAQYNAQIMDNNAALKDIQAQQAIDQGEFSASIAAIEGRGKIERQRAGYAASGVKVDAGSALDVVAEQAGFNQIEQDVIRYDAATTAWGIRSEAANLRAQAELTRNSGINPGLAATTSLLGGATSLYNQYRQYQIGRVE